MRVPRLLLVAALVAAFAVVTNPTTASADTPWAPARMGVASAYTLMYESDADQARDLDAIVAAGAQWLRFDLAWSVVEQTQGHYDWSTIDRLVNAASSRGLRLLPTLTYTPSWAQPAGAIDDKYPPTPDHYDDYAHFAAAAASRYAYTIHRWEIWNEENTDAFWAPHADPAGYAVLLEKAAAAIRAVSYSRIVLGGLAATGPQWGGITQTDYLTALYAAGAGDSFDSVGLHATSVPYLPDDPLTQEWNVLFQLPRLHFLLGMHGDADKRLWITEYGYPSTGYTGVSEAQEALAVTGAYAMQAACGSWCGPLFWYTPRDKGSGSTAWDDNCGLLREDFSPKPAYLAYAAVAATLSGDGAGDDGS